MEIVTNIAPIILIIMMFGLGLGLTINDFKKVIITPKNFFVGIACQLILLPIVAYILILIFKSPIEIAMGLMIISAAPGGVTSNILTKFANGNVALSISLTGITSLISIISVPFIVFTSAYLLGETNLLPEISITRIGIKMALVVTLPVILGMIVRGFMKNIITSNTNIINKITGLLFVIVFMAIWIEEKENINNVYYRVYFNLFFKKFILDFEKIIRLKKLYKKSQATDIFFSNTFETSSVL